MSFSFKTILTDEDYILFNKFTMQKTEYGKKSIRSVRTILTIVFLAIEIFIMISSSSALDMAISSLPLIAVFALIQLIWLPLQSASIKGTVESMKKIGKLPYTPNAQMEFKDTYFTETTELTKTASKYAVIEGIYVVKDRYIYIYTSQVAGHIIPLHVIPSLAEYNDFIEFLKGKCEKVFFIDKI